MNTNLNDAAIHVYQIRSRKDGWAELHATGLGAIGIIRKPRMIRDAYTLDQLMAVSISTGLDRAGLDALLNMAVARIEAEYDEEMNESVGRHDEYLASRD